MRLNFSHGDYEEHGMRMKNFRQAMSETGIRGGILLDTKGPENKDNDFKKMVKILVLRLDKNLLLQQINQLLEIMKE